ncbi:hypothetical protein ARMSODRAFT_1024930 [Armillaria solidipes]|uniref:Uncharacterized protein n=1 Tax=Armillaria solidipes TaxID=1076256 RepID=A0A2H3AUF1_9AGAR|nr:hypothetical protein ARMSODRAFT_1024930 [Armillaria solidipes]
MDHEETFIQRWWRSKKLSVSEWWKDRKMSLYEFFERSPKSSPLVEGTKSAPLHHVNRPNLPKTTLSALVETDQAGSTIPVQIQRSYTGNQSVISSAPDSDLSTNDELPEITLSALAETGKAESTMVNMPRTTVTIESDRIIFKTHRVP